MIDLEIYPTRLFISRKTSIRKAKKEFKKNRYFTIFEIVDIYRDKKKFGFRYTLKIK